jgi:hypothetical protein
MVFMVLTYKLTPSEQIRFLCVQLNNATGILELPNAFSSKGEKHWN